MRGDDWLYGGRYAHWDNYPERMVPTLGALVRRDGYAKVLDTLLMRNFSWSIVDEHAKEDASLPNRVAGYGDTHCDADDIDSWITLWPKDLENDLWGAEFVYVIDDVGVTTFNALDLRNRIGYHTWEVAR